MEFNQLVQNVEAMIFASDRPLTESEIIELVNNRHESQEGKEDLKFEEEVEEQKIKQVIETIIEKYAQDFYPFEVKYSGGGYSFLTKPAYHETVAPVCQDKKIKKLSSAAMETLAIIAYKQPVTKAQIEYIRGVSAEYSVQKLMEKELIVIAGRKEDAIGKPLLYKTTENLIDYLGIESYEELPRLSEMFDIDTVLASKVESDGQTAEPESEVNPDPEQNSKGPDETPQTIITTESNKPQNHKPLIRTNEDITEGVDLQNRKELLNNLESETSIEETEE